MLTISIKESNSKLKARKALISMKVRMERMVSMAKMMSKAPLVKNNKDLESTQLKMQGILVALRK